MIRGRYCVAYSGHGQQGHAFYWRRSQAVAAGREWAKRNVAAVVTKRVGGGLELVWTFPKKWRSPGCWVSSGMSKARFVAWRGVGEAPWA